MKNLAFLIFATIIGLSSCKKEKADQKLKNDSEFAQELRSSPESLTIANNDLVLTTYLWRDFMPIAEEDGSKMMCVNKLTDIDSIAISNTIILKKQYVIKGDEIWIANYSEISNNVDFILEGLVREGPKWTPNIEVDVVCEFENSGTTYRILAKSQVINKTD